MKKIIIFFIFTFLLCDCQNPTARNKENVETVCSFDISEINISYELEADDIDSDVSKLRFKTILPYDSFRIDSSNLKESDKTEIRSSLISQLGVNNDSSISFTNAVKQFEDKGATCK